MDFHDVGTVTAILFSVASAAMGYGKANQKVEENQKATDLRFKEASERFKEAAEANNRRFNEHERMHGEHYKLVRDHNDRDQEHFQDTDVHWTSNERQLLWRRYDDLKERINELKLMNERQEKLLQEILLRGKNPN